MLLAEPLCIFFHSRAGKVVVKNHRLISRAQRVCQIAPDKSAAARDYNGAFPLSRTDVAPAQPGGVFDGFDSSLREQTKEKFFRVIVAAQSEMMLALVTVEFVFIRKLRRIEIVRAVPVNALGRRMHRVDESCNLASLVMSPRRVAGLGDPYLGFRAMLQKHLAYPRDLRVPTVPPKFERAGETVNADCIDVLHHATLAHQTDPLRIHRSARAEHGLFELDEIPHPRLGPQVRILPQMRKRPHARLVADQRFGDHAMIEDRHAIADLGADDAHAAVDFTPAPNRGPSLD